ncbi:MAG: iron ABC transporter permease [Pacificimonas sp.]|nr:iron ABC transporter permease [Pacificimonas sp.]
MPYAVLLALLGAGVAGAFVLSLMTGPAAAGFGALFGQGEAGAAILIMQEIRLPRALLGVLIGGVLGLSGAALQGLLRNPLAEPGIIGVSGAAAFGAVVAIYTGLSLIVPLALPLLAMLGALAAVALLYGLAGNHSTTTLILAGVAISSLAGALTSLALNLSPNPFAALEILFWMLGSLADRSMDHVALAAPFMAVGALLLLATGRSLEALGLGEEAALGMGIDLKRVRTLAVLGTALAVGAAVAVSGVIGFVGLIVPHLLRPLVGHNPARLLPVSFLGGALLLTLADVLVRIIAPSSDLKLGVVTALIGAPFFIALVLRSRRTGAF